MYGAAGENRPLYNLDDPNIRDRVVQMCPPTSPYIEKSFEGILMYELAGGFINNYFNYADPTNIGVVPRSGFSFHT